MGRYLGVQQFQKSYEQSACGSRTLVYDEKILIWLVEDSYRAKSQVSVNVL